MRDQDIHPITQILDTSQPAAQRKENRYTTSMNFAWHTPLLIARLESLSGRGLEKHVLFITMQLDVHLRHCAQEIIDSEFITPIIFTIIIIIFIIWLLNTIIIIKYY